MQSNFPDPRAFGAGKPTATPLAKAVFTRWGRGRFFLVTTIGGVVKVAATSSLEAEAGGATRSARLPSSLVPATVSQAPVA